MPLGPRSLIPACQVAWDQAHLHGTFYLQGCCSCEMAQFPFPFPWSDSPVFVFFQIVEIAGFSVICWALCVSLSTLMCLI